MMRPMPGMSGMPPMMPMPQKKARLDEPEGTQGEGDPMSVEEVAAASALPPPAPAPAAEAAEDY